MAGKEGQVLPSRVLGQSSQSIRLSVSVLTIGLVRLSSGVTRSSEWRPCSVDDVDFLSHRLCALETIGVRD
jgi:hypothetical protein